MTEKKNSERNSSIELLRIFAALAVIVVHYNYNHAFRSDGLGGANLALLHIVDSISIPAVDIFMVITGYFSCLSNRRSIGKPINLIFQVVFWHVFFYMISVMLGNKDFTIKNLAWCIINPDYFVTLYVVVYVFSPYINMIIEKMPIRDFRFLLFLCISVFSLWAFPIDVLYRDFNVDLKTGSPVGVGGGHGGCSFVNFCLAYLVGAYIRRADVRLSWQKSITCFLGSATLLCCWRYIELSSLGIESIRLTARSYHNPLVLLQASMALLFVRNFDFRRKYVNKLASAAFTCYMVQHFFLYRIGVSQVVHEQCYIFLIHMTISVVAIFLISYLFSYMYNNSLGKMFSSLEKRTIPYYQ